MEGQPPDAAPSNSLTSSVASSARWSILRRAFVPSSSVADPTDPSRVTEKNVSRKPAGSFNMIPCHVKSNHSRKSSDTVLKSQASKSGRDSCISYTLPTTIPRELILFIRTESCVDLNDFEISNRYDIDNTGLICCWPSEDVLAYFCLNHAEIFRSKRIIELGSGYGLAGLSIAAGTDAYEVVISDGNPQVIDYIQRNITVNTGCFGDTKVKSMILHWNQELDSSILHSFDVIVASDCTFFKEFHEGLARSLKSLLRRSENSEALLLSPKRGDSLDKFIQKLKDVGLNCEVTENYDGEVWTRHLKIANGIGDSWPNYDKDHCYPLLIRITF